MIEKQAVARSIAYQQKPVASLDEALVQNYEKGVVAGMRLAIHQPQTMVEILREQFNVRLAEERANV